MVELFFLIGLLGWLGAVLFEFLYSQPFFPSVASALLVVPLVAWCDYHWLSQKMPFRRIETLDKPIPPERFYWKIVRRRIGRELWLLAVTLPVAWLTLVFYPVGRESTFWVGLIATLVALWSSGRILSRATLYFNASQWYDKMTPRFMGWLRNWMYRISDNPEFLSDDPPKKKEKETVY